MTANDKFDQDDYKSATEHADEAGPGDVDSLPPSDLDDSEEN